ncbi:twin-arginine translocase TatA/TatE family subunit [Allokutzneria oryzae]|uniref:Twin-arginine translocase TatA/TatE family subunit n=1 Tax=Allokutzneria oryzae TaxID=1378989 RepID=A0ABV5ZX58_9PSEU
MFGAKKIPDAARGVGQSMRILKAELAADDRSTNPAHATPPSPTPPHHDQLTVKPPREDV